MPVGIISVIIHENNITQTDDHQSACELFRSCSYDPNQKRSTTGFDKGPNNPQSTKNHIVAIFNPFMPGSNKRAYIRT